MSKYNDVGYTTSTSSRLVIVNYCFGFGDDEARPSSGLISTSIARIPMILAPLESWHCQLFNGRSSESDRYLSRYSPMKFGLRR